MSICANIERINRKWDTPPKGERVFPARLHRMADDVRRKTARPDEWSGQDRVDVQDLLCHQWLLSKGLGGA